MGKINRNIYIENILLFNMNIKNILRLRGRNHMKSPRIGLSSTCRRQWSVVDTVHLSTDMLFIVILSKRTTALSFWNYIKNSDAIFV